MDPDELYGIVNNNITSVFGDDRQNYLPSDESETDIGLGQKLINDDPNTDEFSSLFTCLFPLFSDPKFNLSFGNLQQALPQFPISESLKNRPTMDFLLFSAKSKT